MELSAKQQEGQQVIQNLIAKAWESASFKEQLINNPQETIESVLGKKLNVGDAQLVVEDQTDSDVIYLNIPRKVELDELELTDEQLEMVSGGVAPIVIYGGIFLVGVIAGALAD